MMRSSFEWLLFFCGQRAKLDLSLWKHLKAMGIVVYHNAIADSIRLFQKSETSPVLAYSMVNTSLKTGPRWLALENLKIRIAAV